MTEKIKVEPWEAIQIRRTDSGWDYCMRAKNGGIVGKVAATTKTFDEAVAKAKEEFDVT